VQQVGEAIRQATDTYMQARSTGVRGTRSLFTLHTENLTPTTVSSTLVEVPKTAYTEFTVSPSHTTIRDAVQAVTGSYRQGSTFYQLVKTENIQPQKEVAVKDKANGKLYSGRAARQLLGLPDAHARVAPTQHPNYDIFVQSTSSNRKLVPFTTAIVMN
jgi:hypothetical protein